MPFKPGVSGNPKGLDSGRKRLSLQLADKLKDNIPAALKFVKSSLSCTKDPYRQQWATELVLNRVYGKAPESLEISGPDGEPISIMSDKTLTPEEFMAKFAPLAEDEPKT